MAPRGGGPDDMVAAYDSNDEHRDRGARRGDASCGCGCGAGIDARRARHYITR